MSEARGEEYREPGTYRIRLEGWNEYHARRFVLTDSTVVIEELLRSDDRYKRLRDEMPVVIPLKEAREISRMETNVPMTTALLVAGGAALGYFIWLMISLSGLSGLD